jgi:hypothetical protein
MKTAMLLASVAAIALGAPAFAAEKETFKSETKVEKDAKGNYEAKSSATKTDTAGTTTAVEKKVDVDVDKDGSKETTVKTTESTDPKGLGNKTKTVTKDTEEVKADGTVEAEHKKTVDGKTVEHEKSKQ